MPRRKTMRMSTPGDIRRCIARINNMLLNDEIDPKRANAIIYGCNAALSAIRIDEQQAKLDELEKMVEELNHVRR